MRNGTTRVCAWDACVIWFVAYNGTHRYCSRECYRKARWQQCAPHERVDHPERVCVRCGATFKPKTAARIYCSVNCNSRAHYWRNPKGWRPRFCMECGLSFKPQGPNGALCSQDCRDRRRRRTVVPRLHGIVWRQWERYATRSGRLACDLCGSEDPGRGWRIDHESGHCPGAKGCIDCVRAHLCSRCNDHREPAVRECIALGLMAIPVGPLAAFHGPLSETPFQRWRAAQEALGERDLEHRPRVLRRAGQPG
jgi:hypothetical protein